MIYYFLRLFFPFVVIHVVILQVLLHYVHPNGAYEVVAHPIKIYLRPKPSFTLNI